jgi:hypothetical protein
MRPLHALIAISRNRSIRTFYVWAQSEAHAVLILKHAFPDVEGDYVRAITALPVDLAASMHMEENTAVECRPGPPIRVPPLTVPMGS